MFICCDACGEGASVVGEDAKPVASTGAVEDAGACGFSFSQGENHRKGESNLDKVRSMCTQGESMFKVRPNPTRSRHKMDNVRANFSR